MKYSVSCLLFSALVLFSGCDDRQKMAYVSSESEKNIWSDCYLRNQHPSFLWAKGVIPGDIVDDEVMNYTLYLTKSSFNFNAIWGWDPPMMAMTATRLQKPDWAVDFLFTTSRNNRYLINGHCPQWNFIYAYLPANGGTPAGNGTDDLRVGW